MGQFAFMAVFSTIDLTGKWLFGGSTLLGQTSRDVSYKSRFLGEGSPAMGTADQTFPGALSDVVLSATSGYNFLGTDRTEIWTLEVNVCGDADLTHVYLQWYNHIHHTGGMNLPYAGP